ncbi:hypothetical protein BCR36DRAFT_580848 [Piromyces finnis]|uniref:EF-hand domain-containing protein n=1 Tax=Piromyces finnis TaxID=1754191 RepID=A0A1Y1VHM9_9FUNG|nr:hypothetical protein BCR36DRAFT_580848 [Piromyces finnis]|eukprot:ORX56539.1 hypothetical protein BCR36DRAFT_580848 [Piromyces finnis]
MATRAPISFLKPDGTLTDKLCHLLKEIFITFDKDQDGVLSREELKHYFSILSGVQLSEESLDLTMLMISGNIIGFTLTDFFSFYEYQTHHYYNETMKDLSRLYNQKTIQERLFT